MARIRTIKPEFWQNEQLALLSQHARLLAIALLNYADDRGCFLANPSLVRAACFPFEEDSRNVLGSLQELSGIGYIEVRSCGGKSIGIVCKFLEHQRIDKPQKSRLIDIFEQNINENSNSKNVPGIVLECSGKAIRLEGNGKGMEKEEEWNGKGKTLSLAKQVLPVSVQEFFDRWNKFATKHPKLKTCRKLTPEREKKIRTRLKEEKWFPDFLEAVAALPLGGDGWQPTLDWLVENEVNAYRLLEGQFDWRSRDDPAALALAKRRRQEAYEQREEFEKCKQQENKANANGLHRAIKSTLPVTVGKDENGFGSGTLFEPDDTLFANGVELTNHCT